jgi:hypothetical protein
MTSRLPSSLKGLGCSVPVELGFRLPSTTWATAALAVIGTTLLPVFPSVATAGGLTDRLVGTWRLARFVNTAANGKVTYPFGEHPSGYFVYDPTGHLSVQLMRMPPTAAFAAGDDDKGTDAEVRAAYDGLRGVLRYVSCRTLCASSYSPRISGDSGCSRGSSQRRPLYTPCACVTGDSAVLISAADRGPIER